MTPPAAATLADLLAWRPPPGCRLVIAREHDGRCWGAVDTCCACLSLWEGPPPPATTLQGLLDRRARDALLERDRRHAAHPDACRGDVLAALAARGAEAVGAGDGRPNR